MECREHRERENKKKATNSVHRNGSSWSCDADSIFLSWRKFLGPWDGWRQNGTGLLERVK